jgi:hypothetical protein
MYDIRVSTISGVREAKMHIMYDIIYDITGLSFDICIDYDII